MVSGMLGKLRSSSYIMQEGRQMAGRSILRSTSHWLHKARHRCYAAAAQNQGSKEHAAALQRMPAALIKAMRAGWFTITQAPGSGRGLVAIKDIPQGANMLREWPLAAVPATAVKQQVCHHCLLPFDFPHIHPISGACFCSSCAKQLDSNPLYDLEAVAQLQSFTELCQQQGARFPLLAARMALQILAASGMPHGTNTASQQSQHTLPQPNHAQQTQQTEPDYTDVSYRPIHVVQGNVVKDLPFLCFANVKKPYPEEWVEQWTLLHQGLCKAAGYLIKQSSGKENRIQDGTTPSVTAAQQAHQILQQCGLDLDWYASILSRLHVNVFRVDTIVLPRFGGASGFDLASATAALLAGNSTVESTASTSEPTSTQQQQQQSSRLPLTSPTEGGGTGSAVYTVASLINHSCEPNLDVVFPLNNSQLVLRAARDIAAGEQLTISYIDATQPVQQRQRELMFGYGFNCRCALCDEDLQDRSM